MTVDIERIYDHNQEQDVVRVLVDRVWPRGISKEKAQLDHWLKDVGPTTELRKWFNHDPQRFQAFKEKYEQELRHNDDQKAAFKELQDIVNNNEHVLLLYAAKDEQYNQAVVLQQLLTK
ncbi:DUF488 family protein [Staphylococcus simiae]|uniref:DUF488 domain-containing protein n=1 Tax=Staphylococcus simiae TaxID=308354 RepID=UPI001A96A20E|nr:DUF488 family protein [Staphylococcus simiae]MBO1199859.1 DUF488 family protein [Staphylococcus simiae]MBO1202286.1 DUF488 family protein [Staphylococcus simiae]MBO1204546.1 DUF488 family protein [Staphylococcus simiae]MBO1211918.1 DUF488 family protein [Staphylococcus simiae]MBO1230711.1 DUF488 family protein [Staphylococcus simiae]